MADFEGFSGSSQLSIPSNFFSESLPNITDLLELKILLLIFQLTGRSEEQFPYFYPDELAEIYFPAEMEHYRTSLELAVKRGWLLLIEIEVDQQKRAIGFLNTPRGRAAIQAIKDGTFRFSEGLGTQRGTISARPDIFKLYEENIGVITPIIADHLKDLEENYSVEWISEAIQTAVKNNARSLRYVEVVLQNWQEEGKHVGTDRRRRKKSQEEYDPDRYTDGDFSDFIDH